MNVNCGKDWRLIQESGQDAFTSMAVDEAVVRVMVDSDGMCVPTVRIYTWKENSLSIGYFQKISDVLGALGTEVDRGNLDIVRRPTGGTAVLHDGGPSFSLVLRDGARMSSGEIMGLYSLLGRCVADALRRLGISAEIQEDSNRFPRNGSNLCASSLCPCDVVSRGRKVAGYAARRFRGVTLVQGYAALADGLTGRQLGNAIISALKDVTGAGLLDGTLTDEEGTLAAALRTDKYARREWNYRR